MTETGVLLLLGSLGFLLLVAREQFLCVQRATRAARWPRVSATILTSEIVEEAFTPFGERGRWYWLTVTYAYEVDGHAYVGNRLSFFDVGAENRYRAETILSPYPVGAVVAAFCDPDDPLEPILDPRGPRWFGFLEMTLGALPFLAMGILLVVNGPGFS